MKTFEEKAERAKLERRAFTHPDGTTLVGRPGCTVCREMLHVRGLGSFKVEELLNQGFTEVR